MIGQYPAWEVIHDLETPGPSRTDIIEGVKAHTGIGSCLCFILCDDPPRPEPLEINVSKADVPSLFEESTTPLLAVSSEQDKSPQADSSSQFLEPLAGEVLRKMCKDGQGIDEVEGASVESAGVEGAVAGGRRVGIRTVGSYTFPPCPPCRIRRRASRRAGRRAVSPTGPTS